jgi:hypothetical protein
MLECSSFMLIFDKAPASAVNASSPACHCGSIYRDWRLSYIAFALVRQIRAGGAGFLTVLAADELSRIQHDVRELQVAMFESDCQTAMIGTRKERPATSSTLRDEMVTHAHFAL